MSKPTQTSTRARQTTLDFGSSGTIAGRTSTRAAAGRARGKMANVVSRFHNQKFAINSQSPD